MYYTVIGDVVGLRKLYFSVNTWPIISRNNYIMISNKLDTFVNGKKGHW
jgi:hypothetical protein